MAAQTIRTRRLDLLPLRVEHAEEMAGVLADPALHRFIGGTPYTPDALAARYRRLVAGSPDAEVTWLNWVIRLREESRLTGTVQATLAASGTAEIAWVVGTPWQGRGIAKEAALALATWLTAHPVHSITAHIHPDHHASATVAGAAGLAPTPVRQDGEVRWEWVRHAGSTGGLGRDLDTTGSR